jgi:RHS repeat-associated protein
VTTNRRVGVPFVAGLLSAVSTSTPELVHADRLGSVRALTDASGTVTATYRTDAYGVPTTTTGSSGQPFGFTGEPVDPTGLVNLRARMYDPTTGRFTSRDSWPGSVTLPTSLDRYVYVQDNPATLTDPSGLDTGGWVLTPPAKSKVLGGREGGPAVVRVLSLLVRGDSRLR